MALQKLGIKETKEGLALVFAIANATGKSLADGKFGISDIPHWIPVSTKVTPAIDNFKAIWPELKDLDAAEVAELQAWGKMEFDIPQDEFERYFELGYTMLLNLVELIDRFFSLRKAAARAAEPFVMVQPKAAAPVLALAAPEPAKVVEKAAETVEEVAKAAEENFVSKAKKAVSRKKK